MSGNQAVGGTAPAPAAAAAGSAMPPLIEFCGVVKRFGAITAVDGVDLIIQAGEFFTLLGPSGCGKTTLLRILAGFDVPTSGTVRVAGSDLAGVPPHRRPVNMMFQSYALFPHMSVERNIAFGLKMAGLGAQATRRRVGEMLDLVQLGDCGKRAPHQLSGGQRQRVALARALARQPKVLLLDEPLSALDKKLRQETRFELTRIQKELGITFVIVTHDQEEALSLSDRIAVMNRGGIEQIAAPVDLYRRPASRYVAEFVGTINFLEVRVVERTATIVRLDCGGVAILTDAANGPGVRAGEVATLAIRPEDLAISVGARPPEHLNRVRGVVGSVAYLGDRSVWRVSVGGDRVMQVSVADASVRAFAWGSGDEVDLVWSRGAGVLLTR